MIEINENTSYVRVPTRALFEKDMSLAAKAIYSILCWCPENWEYSISGFEGLLKEGRAAISSALRDLEKHGYLTRKRVRDERGGLGKIDYKVYADPITVEREQGDRKQDNDTDNIISKEIIIEDNYINGINPFLLTADLGTFEKFLRRPLRTSEIEIWKSWKESNINPRILLLAFKDNEYRGINNNLSYVNETLNRWIREGCRTAKDVENAILDAWKRNITAKMNEIAEFSGKDPEQIGGANTVCFLVEWRDLINRAYRTRDKDFERMIETAPIEVFKYLSNDILYRAIEIYEKKGNLELLKAAYAAIEKEADQ